MAMYYSHFIILPNYLSSATTAALKLSYSPSLECLQLLMLGSDSTIVGGKVAALLQTLSIWVLHTSDQLPRATLYCPALIAVTANISLLALVGTGSMHQTTVAVYTGDSAALSTKHCQNCAAILVGELQPNTISVTDMTTGVVMAEWNAQDSRLILSPTAPSSLWLHVGKNICHKQTKSSFIPTVPSRVRVSLFHCPPFVISSPKINNTSENEEYDGIEIHMLKALLGDLPTTFISKDKGIWKKNITKWDSVYEDIVKQRADIALCSMWVTKAKLQEIDVSMPWTKQFVSFLAPKPTKVSMAKAIYLSFEAPVWQALAGIIIIIIITLSTFTKILLTSELSSKDRKYLSIRYCVLSIFRLLSMNALPRLPDHTILRHIITFWSIFSLLVTTCYSTGFTSLLASPPLSSPINTFKDILQTNVYWGESYNFIQSTIEETGNNDLIRFGLRFREEKSPKDRELRLKEGNYAIFVKAMSNYVMGAELLLPSARENLRMMKEPLFSFFVALGLQKNSPFKARLNCRMKSLFHGGLIEYWKRDAVHKLHRRYMINLFEDHSHTLEHVPLNIETLQGAFLVLCCGVVISIPIMILENIIYKFKPKWSEVLQLHL